ncbi:sensor histidine kinase [Lacinutrix sp. WUR7]|uniref:tetratricopeptide repeat-containing sensor histidine kinase n=1 Tax=Lacinutrix sp. WUR7 TaxID=2653681 RepID=UPI00193D5350|nr:sensor histidine kinase [Lacinutrix sp. WUR7]
MRYLLLCISLLMFQLSFSQKDEIVDFGQNLIHENKLDEAITYYAKRLVEPRSEEQKIHLLLGFAEVYKLKLDYNTASDYYIKAFESIKNIDDKQLKFLYHVKMAEFFRKRTMLAESAAQLDKAALILKGNKVEDLYLAKYYNRKAALFTEFYHIQDSTLFYANKSLDLSKKIKDKDNVFYSLLEIAGVYERKKDYKTAIRYLEEIIDVARSNNMEQQEADAYISYIMALSRSNQLDKALKMALYAADFSKKNNLLYNEIIFNENIQNLYFRLNNTEKAYEYLKDRLALTTKYNEIQKEELLLNVEAQYKLTDKENQITINNLEIINQKKELASNQIKLLVSIGLLIAVISLALLISYFLKKEKKSNKQLKHLSQENQFLLSEANHRINNNLQLVVILISDQLKKSSKDNNFQLKNILTKVEAISTLHKHLYKNEDIRTVDACSYLNDVKKSFFALFAENNIQTNFKIASVDIPSDYAMYLGLLLSELSINSIKHAFHTQENKGINFELKHNDNWLSFHYSDNGTTSLNKTMKPKLVDKICRQMEMDYKITTENGFSFSLVKELHND